MRRVKSTIGNKKDLALRALVSFESNDPIVDCSNGISDLLEREYNNLLRKCGIENRRSLDESGWQSDLAALVGSIPLYSGSCKAIDTNCVRKFIRHARPTLILRNCMCTKV